jgi:hypothetical protein
MQMQRVPMPVLVALAILLLAAPVGLALDGGQRPQQADQTTLADIARRAGCTLTDFTDGSAASNPPVTGRIVERAVARDGSYAGRRPPSPLATMHSLLHGRVLFQYRGDLSRDELRPLDHLTRRDRDGVLLFENQTGMRPRVAATAYLSRMTCPRVDPTVLDALAAFRDRRRGFVQSF